jgi:hypothetical protein
MHPSIDVWSRCDCPDHSAASQPWAGQASLPQSFSNNFGAAYSGEFLVTSVSNDTNATADWRLVCLQFNDAAQLVVDGITRLVSNQATDLGAGYLQNCKALRLDEVGLPAPPPFPALGKSHSEQ